MGGNLPGGINLIGIELGFNLLTGEAASQSLKETIDKDYCECGIPLETFRESEAPLKERSERV